MGISLLSYVFQTCQLITIKCMYVANLKNDNVIKLVYFNLVNTIIQVN